MFKNLLFGCLLLAAYNPTAVAQQINPIAPVTGKTFFSDQPANKNLKNGVTDDWLSKAQSYIASSEYFFNPCAGSTDYSVANKKQRTGFIISDAGFRASPIRFIENPKKDDQWEFN